MYKGIRREKEGKKRKKKESWALERSPRKLTLNNGPANECNYYTHINWQCGHKCIIIMAPPLGAVRDHERPVFPEGSIKCACAQIM